MGRLPSGKSKLPDSGANHLGVLNWAEPYVTDNFPGPASMKEIVSCAAKADAAATIQWMAERHGKLTPEQEAVAFPIIAREMLAQDPQKLADHLPE